MSASVSRAFPGMPKGRAARLAYFAKRVRATEDADPVHALKVLFRMANPSYAQAIDTTRIENGRVRGHTEHHELMRRCFVLRAWCAQKIGWRNELRVALFAAGVHRRLARSAREAGR